MEMWNVLIIQVFGYRGSQAMKSASRESTITMFNYPSEVLLLEAKDKSMIVQWVAPEDASLLRHQILMTDIKKAQVL